MGFMKSLFQSIFQAKKQILFFRTNQNSDTIIVPDNTQAMMKIIDFLQNSKIDYCYVGHSKLGEIYQIAKLTKNQQQKFLQALINLGFEIK